ncbi:MAG: glutaredoxin family protein [Candidatus Dormibacteria bacterium]
MLATRWCGDCRSARRVLDTAGVDDWIDIDENQEASDEVMRVNRIATPARWALGIRGSRTEADHHPASDDAREPALSTRQPWSYSPTSRPTAPGPSA